MNIIALAIAGTLFIIGIFVGKVTTNQKNTTEITPSVTVTPTETPFMTTTPTNKETPTTTPKQTDTPTQKITPTQKPSSGSTDTSMIYPNLSISSQSSSKIEGTSPEDPATITTWYENQLKTQGYSSRSSSKTNTNGQVLNKLGGGKNNQTTLITVSKKSSENITHVTIEFQNGTDGSVRIEIHNTN